MRPASPPPDSGIAHDGAPAATVIQAHDGAPIPRCPEDEDTVDDVLERIGFTPTHWLLFVAAGLVWSADAMCVMLMSFLGPAVRTCT